MRSLPEKVNPLLQTEHTPQREIDPSTRLDYGHTDAVATLDEVLVERRRLGQTNIAVREGQVGTANATKPENLGIIEYAHLRVPLPKNLKGSEIFASRHPGISHPESYFLMVRMQ